MIYQTIKQTSKKFPNKIALVSRGKEYTYSELMNSVDSLAAVLITAIMPGEKVLFASEKEYHYVRMVLACDKLGITFVPTYPNIPKEVVDVLVSAAKIEHVILSEEDAKNLKPHNKGLVYHSPPETLYTVIFTSGTTGEPKGVMHTNKSCYNGCLLAIDTFNLKHDDVVLAQLPAPTIAGLYTLSLPGLMVGCTVYMEAFNPRTYADIHNTYKPTVFIIVPAMVVAMSKLKSWQQLDLSHTRQMSTGSTVVPTEMLKHLFDKGAPRIRHLYGCTETHVPAMTHVIESDSENWMQLDFRPEFQHKFDRFGSLWLKGDTMMKGYINADTGLDAYGYWNSEDIFERKHNKLFYKSRQKDLIKVNSYNVSPVNIENAILQYPNILEVCVTYRSRDMGEKEIVALVCTELSINTSELISFVKEKLFAYEIPKEIIIVEEPLVRNRMGKIQREANREKFVI